MKKISLSVFVAHLVAVSVAFSVPSENQAEACGPQPESAVFGHFSALNGHDRAALLSQWQPNAPVTSIDLKGNKTTQPIEKAADRWLTTTKPVTFNVVNVEDKPNGDAIAHVTVNFNDAPFDDLVTIRFDKGRFRIVEKTTRQLPSVTKVAAASPY